jgi:hypothetical protein
MGKTTTKRIQMKRLLFWIGLAVSATALTAATVTQTVVTVGAPAINCVFNTNCTSIVTDTSSPIALPNTSGLGFLQTRTYLGQTGSLGQGLYVYEYRIDLRAVTANAGAQPCFSNHVQCVTNAGVVTCSTNLVSCPGSAPCIDELRLNFGALSGLTVTNPLGSTGQVFVITSGGLGSNGPSSVVQNGSVVTLRFADPICPGESSYFIGLVSSNAPTTTRAVLDLTSGSNILVSARTPRITGRPITCDFSALSNAIAQLALSDILAPNDHARAGRRGALLNNVNAAVRAAERGDLEGVLDALGMIANKTGNKGNPWVRPAAGHQIGLILDPLLDCLEQFHGDADVDHDDDADDDDDQGSNGNNGNHGNNGNNGNNRSNRNHNAK